MLNSELTRRGSPLPLPLDLFETDGFATNIFSGLRQSMADPDGASAPPPPTGDTSYGGAAPAPAKEPIAAFDDPVPPGSPPGGNP